MKIEKINEETTHLSKTKAFDLEIDIGGGNTKEITIMKHWFENIVYNVDWDFEDDKDQKWFDNLEVEEQDEIDDFISELN